MLKAWIRQDNSLRRNLFSEILKLTLKKFFLKIMKWKVNCSIYFILILINNYSEEWNNSD